jgi:hypothetical protein
MNAVPQLDENTRVPGPGRPSTVYLCWLAASMLSAAPGTRAAPELTVGVVPATHRVERDESIADRPREIHISAAANEYEPFQVVVQASGGPIRNIDATFTPLRCRENGHILRDIELFRIYYLYVLQTSGGYGFLKRIEYPGPMLPFEDPYGPPPGASGAEANATEPASGLDRLNMPSLAERRRRMLAGRSLKARSTAPASSAKKTYPYAAPFDNSRIGSPAKPYRNAADGPAFLFVSGAYTGTGDHGYVVQIEKTGNAGETTFRWSDSWQGGLDGAARATAWNAENVPIPPFNANQRTPDIPLNNGVSIYFNAGKKEGISDFFERHTYHFRVYDKMNEVIWGDVHIPPETPPGLYEGTLKITADDVAPVDIPIQLTVWDFELPRKRSIISAFHGSLSGGYFAGNPRDMGDRYEQLAHKHRIDPQRIPGASIGNVQNVHEEWDWSAFDKAVAPRFDGSYFPDGAALAGSILPNYGPGNEWSWSFYAKKSTENLEKMGERVAAHLKEKGWFDKFYFYCNDEPYPGDDPAIRRDVQAILKGDPGWRGKFMCTTAPNPNRGLIGFVDVWCIKPHWGLRHDVRANGDKVWCYMANSPYSPVYTYHIDTLKGYEPRVAKWAAWKLGSEAFLYWAMALNPVHPNPWVTAMTEYEAVGDGTFVYAGARNGPVCNDNATPLRPYEGPLVDFRVKQIREGMEDWEYLILLEKRKGRSAAMKIAYMIHKRDGLGYGRYPGEAALDDHWTQDPEAFYRAREKIAAELSPIRETAPFDVSKPYLKLWLKGKGHPERAYIAIVDHATGREITRSSGEGDGQFKPVALPVDKLMGRKLVVRLVNRDNTGEFSVGIDRLTLSDDNEL